MPRVVSADSRTTVAALSLLYGRWPDSERKQFVRDALESAAQGRFDLRHLVVAVDDDEQRVVAAGLAVERPGREAVVWTPGLQPGAKSNGLGLAILGELSRRLDGRDVVCAVCFADPSQAGDRELLEAAGFPGIADLCLLRSDPQTLLHRPTPRLAGLGSIPWSGKMESRFAQTIDVTQREGFDCPEVEGLRSGLDILASHRATSVPEADLWRLYSLQGAESPIGVILLADHSDKDALEVLYIGVVPAARRLGVARAMLNDARGVAKRRRRSSLTVAVESRNKPALELYAGEQFVETRRYAIHLRVNPHVAPIAS